MWLCLVCCAWNWAAGEVTRVLLTSGKMAYDLAKTRAEVEGSSIKTAIIRIEVRPAAAAAPPCLPSPPAHFVVACSCLSVDDPRLYGTAAQELAPFPTEALHQQLDQFKAVCGTTLCAPRLSAVPLSPLTHMRPCSGHRAPVFCSPLDWLCGSGDVLRVGARGGCRKRCLDVGGCPCVRHEARPQEDCGEYLGCPPTHTHPVPTARRVQFGVVCSVARGRCEAYAPCWWCACFGCSSWVWCARVQLTYIGRPSMAQPAVGMSKRNKVQGDHIIAHAFPKA